MEICFSAIMIYKLCLVSLVIQYVHSNSVHEHWPWEHMNRKVSSLGVQQSSSVPRNFRSSLDRSDELIDEEKRGGSFRFIPSEQLGGNRDSDKWIWTQATGDENHYLPDINLDKRTPREFVFPEAPAEENFIRIEVRDSKPKAPITTIDQLLKTFNSKAVTDPKPITESPIITLQSLSRNVVAEPLFRVGKVLSFNNKPNEFENQVRSESVKNDKPLNVFQNQNSVNEIQTEARIIKAQPVQFNIGPNENNDDRLKIAINENLPSEINDPLNVDSQVLVGKPGSVSNVVIQEGALVETRLSSDDFGQQSKIQILQESTTQEPTTQEPTTQELTTQEPTTQKPEFENITSETPKIASRNCTVIFNGKNFQCVRILRRIVDSNNPSLTAEKSTQEIEVPKSFVSDKFSTHRRPTPVLVQDPSTDIQISLSEVPINNQQESLSLFIDPENANLKAEADNELIDTNEFDGDTSASTLHEQISSEEHDFNSKPMEQKLDNIKREIAENIELQRGQNLNEIPFFVIGRKSKSLNNHIINSDKQNGGFKPGKLESGFVPSTFMDKILPKQPPPKQDFCQCVPFDECLDHQPANVRLDPRNSGSSILSQASEIQETIRHPRLFNFEISDAMPQHRFKRNVLQGSNIKIARSIDENNNNCIHGDTCCKNIKPRQRLPEAPQLLEPRLSASATVNIKSSGFLNTLNQEPVCGQIKNTTANHPWEAVLLHDLVGNSRTVICPLVLIDKHHLLSSGDCVNGVEIQNIRVQIRYQNSFLWIPVDQIKFHPLFIPNKVENNFAIVEMKAFNIPPNDYEIPPVCLPQTRDLSNLECEVPGWTSGSHEKDDSTRIVLSKIHFPGLQGFRCGNQDSQTICSAGEHGKMACSGEGPLICKNPEGALFLAGFPMQCDIPDIPAIYSDVSSSMDWIQSVLSGS